MSAPPPSILTVHYLVYQGNTGKSWAERLPYHPETYLVGDEVNPLAGGIAIADKVVAVSPSFVKETVPPNKGFGLAALLAERGCLHKDPQRG